MSTTDGQRRRASAASTERVPALGSVWWEGERRAAVLDGDRVGVTALPGLDTALARGVAAEELRGHVERWTDRSAVRLDAPLRPPVVFCLGQTYGSHVREKAVAGHPADETPQAPEFFLKAGQTVRTPGEPFVLDPAHIEKLDYETELGVVIGREAFRVPAREALAHVFGYVVVNDLTARERQVRTASDGSRRMAADAAKNFAGATLLGDQVVPAGAVSDPGRLAVTTLVDDEVRQRDSTAGMLFTVAELVSWTSHLLPLLPGSVLATGTPGGTGWARDRRLGGTGTVPDGCSPGRYLRAGQRLVSRVEGLGQAALDIVAPRAA